MNAPNENDIIVSDTMTAEDYHADPVATPSLSSSLAHILVTQSPLHAWHASSRLNPNHKREESGDFDRGSAAHALLLQGEDMMLECPFDDWRTKVAKERREEARILGKLPILSKHVADIRKMVEVAKRALAESELEAKIEDFYAERSVFWHAGGIWRRARFDLQHRTRALIIDYKSTENAEPFAFPSKIVNMGYDIQAAHYTQAYEAMDESLEDPDFIFLVQERTAPYACSLIGVDPMMMELGNQKVDVAGRLWKGCLGTNYWPSYPKSVLWAAAPAWAMASFENRVAMEIK